MVKTVARTKASEGWTDKPGYSICEGFSSHIKTQTGHLTGHLTGDLTGKLIASAEQVKCLDSSKYDSIRRTEIRNAFICAQYTEMDEGGKRWGGGSVGAGCMCVCVHVTGTCQEVPW